MIRTGQEYTNFDKHSSTGGGEGAAAPASDAIYPEGIMKGRQHLKTPPGRWRRRRTPTATAATNNTMIMNGSDEKILFLFGLRQSLFNELAVCAASVPSDPAAIAGAGNLYMITGGAVG